MTSRLLKGSVGAVAVLAVVLLHTLGNRTPGVSDPRPTVAASRPGTAGPVARPEHRRPRAHAGHRHPAGLIRTGGRPPATPGGRPAAAGSGPPAAPRRHPAGQQVGKTSEENARYEVT